MPPQWVLDFYRQLGLEGEPITVDGGRWWLCRNIRVRAVQYYSYGLRSYIQWQTVSKSDGGDVRGDGTWWMLPTLAAVEARRAVR